MLIHNFNSTLLSNEIPKYLLKADMTSAFKKDENFLKTNSRPVSISQKFRFRKYCVKNL